MAQKHKIDGMCVCVCVASWNKKYLLVIKLLLVFTFSFWEYVMLLYIWGWIEMIWVGRSFLPYFFFLVFQIYINILLHMVGLVLIFIRPANAILNMHLKRRTFFFPHRDVICKYYFIFMDIFFVQFFNCLYEDWWNKRRWIERSRKNMIQNHGGNVKKDDLKVVSSQFIYD